MQDHAISIWFFIGISLLVNGILITGAGIWEVISPRWIVWFCSSITPMFGGERFCCSWVCFTA